MKNVRGRGAIVFTCLGAGEDVASRDAGKKFSREHKAVARTGREKARQWAGPGSDSHCTIVTGYMGRRDWRRLDLVQVEQLRDGRSSR